MVWQVELSAVHRQVDHTPPSEQWHNVAPYLPWFHHKTQADSSGNPAYLNHPPKIICINFLGCSFMLESILSRPETIQKPCKYIHAGILCWTNRCPSMSHLTLHSNMKAEPQNDVPNGTPRHSYDYSTQQYVNVHYLPLECPAPATWVNLYW